MRTERKVARIATIDYRLAAFDWAFPADEAARIAAHWAAQCRLKPAMYDGRVLLAHDIAVEGETLRAVGFEAAFKSFFSWRDFAFPGQPIANLFAMAAVRSADGAFMLGEMSAGTANAGQLYFPAGTPEPADADAAGRVDLEASALRELEEETGLGAADVRVMPGWCVVFDGPRVGCMKLIEARATAAELQARLDAFNASQADPELARLVPMRSHTDYDPARMPRFMLTYLDAMLQPRG